jgi:antitoxin component YwqK of YwqJK toxin-antitoxin module
MKTHNCYPINQKQERSGLVYLPNETKPFSGKFAGWYWNDQKKSDENYIDGKRDGKFTYWHENGQKKSRGYYIDGKRVGKFAEWWEYGQKKFGGYYIDD